MMLIRSEGVTSFSISASSDAPMAGFFDRSTAVAQAGTFFPHTQIERR